MENFLIAVNCVIPVFIMICAGSIIRKLNIVPAETFSNLSIVSFKFLLPCTLFVSVYKSNLSAAFDGKMVAYLVVYIIVWFIIGYAVCAKFVPDHRARGAMIQSFFRANTAVVGLSMAEAMMSADGVAAMSVTLAFSVPLFNICAVTTLETCRDGKVHLKPTLVGIAKNPLIIGTVLGTICLVLKIHLPEPVVVAATKLGNAGGVMILIALGGAFRFSGIGKNLKKIVAANIIRLIIAPAAAIAGAVALGFRGTAIGVILLITAPSLATTSYAMAMACDSDHELTGQIVITTSFFCCLTMFLWIFLLKQVGIL